MRRLGAALAALLVVLTATGSLVLTAAAPASAHAILVSSDPTEGRILERAPVEVELRFSETVTPVADAVAVYDAEGDPVASSARARDDLVVVSLDESVAEGTLVLVWRVVSADGHPVGGSLRFSVGAASAAVAEPPQVAATPDDGVVRPPWLLAPLRVLTYVGLLAATGLVVFLLLLLAAGRDDDRPRRRLVGLTRGAALAAGLAAVASLPVVASYQQGGGVGALTSAATWTAVAPTELVTGAGIVLGLLAAVVLLGDGRATGARRVGALAAAAVAVCSPALVGHSRAASPEALVVAADVLHLVAGAVWLGGLVGLAVALPVLARRRGDLAATTLTRFSVAAATVLGVLVVTGSLLGWRIVGSWTALTGTALGLLLLTKVGLALAVVAVAAWNRWSLLPRLRDATRASDRRSGATTVARATAVEAALLVVLLGVTGVLVDSTPDVAEASRAPGEVDPAFTGPHLASLADLEVQAGMSPHTVGPNELTIQVRDATGVPTRTAEPPRVSLATTDLDLGDVELTRIARGTWTADVVLPRPGTWQLQVSLRVSEFENPVSTIDLGVS